MASISRRRLAVYASDELVTGVSPEKLARILAAALIISKKQKQVDLLISDITWELETRGKLANVSVISARSLSGKLRKEITTFIKKTAEVDKVELNEHVDKTVLGGLRIDTATRSWDKTTKRALMEIREAF